jgi:hypothetical protein
MAQRRSGYNRTTFGHVLMHRILAVLGFALMAVGGMRAAESLVLAQQGVHTQGVLLAYRSHEKAVHSMYYPEFRYTDATGQEYHLSGTMGAGAYPYAVGDVIPVIYLPDAPEKARIDDFENLWGPSVIMAGGGALFFFYALLVLIRLHKKKRS